MDSKSHQSTFNRQSRAIDRCAAASELAADSNSRGVIESCASSPIRLAGTQFELLAFRVAWGSKTTESLAMRLENVAQTPDTPCLVRIHSGCITGEALGVDLCDCRWQLNHALKLISRSGNGVVVYCPEHEGRGLGLVNKVRSFELMARGLSTFEAFERLGLPVDLRDYTPAILVLKHLGIRKVQLITNNPAKISVLTSAGFEICGRTPTIMNTTDTGLRSYLRSKASAGHLMNYRSKKWIHLQTA